MIPITNPAGMVDLHCHILPGVDDGAIDLDQSLRMCRMAAADGIETIVATPHVHEGCPLDRETISRAVDVLNAAVGGRPLVVPGGDVHFSPWVEDAASVGSLPTINGTHSVLVEFGDACDPLMVEGAVFRLQVKGYRVVVSHPERLSMFDEHRGFLDRLVSRGCLVQITAGSITGGFGEAAAARAISLLEKGMVHVIATDAHSDIRRRPLLSKALGMARCFLGDRADDLVRRNPACILADAPLPPESFQELSHHLSRRRRLV